MNVDEGYRPGEAMIRAEQVVVGEAISRPGALDDLLDVVRAHHFYRPAHEIIFTAAARLAERGDPVDPVAVMGELTKTGELSKAGGAPYLHDCQALAGPSAKYHARAVADDYRRRMLEAAGTRIAQLAAAPDFDPLLAFDRARIELDDVPSSLDSGSRSFDQLLADAILGLEQETPPSVPTPWSDLNHALSIRPGSVTIVGARPAVGKSVVAAMMAAHVALRCGLPSVIFSLEMSADELMLRILSAEARIPLYHLIHRQLDERDWERLVKVSKWIGKAPLTIFDDPDTSLATVRSKLREVSRKEPPALVVIDYLQLMTGAGKSESRQQDVSALSRGCKLIARQFNVPLVVPAQVNRGPEHRTDKKPTMADLRESGSIESDADNVILLHRDDVHDRESKRAGEIDLIVAKQRMGPTATVTLAFQGHYSRAVDMARLERQAENGF